MKKTKNFSIWEALEFGWQTFFQNLNFYLMALIPLLIPLILFFLMPKFKYFPLPIYVKEATAIAFFLINMSYQYITLKIIRGDKDSISILPSLFTLIKYFVAMYLLYPLITFGGTLLLIIPGIIFSIKYSFAGLVILDKEKTAIWEAFKQSSNITYGCKWKIFFFDLLIGLSAILFILIPCFVIAYVYIYNNLLEQTRVLSQEKTNAI